MTVLNHGMNSPSVAIQNALRSDDIDGVRAWLERHPPPSYEVLQECLLLAMPSGSLEMIDTLLKHGATLSFLAFLADFEREETAVFQKLIDYGWDVDSTEFELPAVQLVLDNERLLRWFLDHGANPNTKSVRRGASCLQPCTPLAAAAEFDDDAPLKLLLAYGAEMDPLALFHAIGVRGQANGMATTIALVEHGADVNYVASLWATPLHYAVQWGAKEKLVYLLEKGADPRRGSRSSEDTPAMFAKAKKQPELVKILEEAEARQEI